MPDEQNLVKAFVGLRDFLKSFGENHWSNIIHKAVVDFDADEIETLKAIRNMFGGMGSLNDLMIAKVNGHLIDTGQEADVNSRFDYLRTAAIIALSRVESRWK